MPGKISLSIERDARYSKSNQLDVSLHIILVPFLSFVFE